VKTRGAAADVASVILLDYYLGEDNAEAQLCRLPVVEAEAYQCWLTISSRRRLC